jgi:malonyl-CoA O-methyltransferase
MSALLRLATLGAYERWAATYPPVPHNPLMRAEQAATLELLPSVAGLRALDLACGTGRYTALLTTRKAIEVTAVDFSAAMLRQVSTGRRVHADMMQLPFAESAFDIVVAGLAIGHAANLTTWTREMARVLATGGTLLYSDFHPDAARAGMTRSFKDELGTTHTVPHTLHELSAHRKAIADAGLILEVVSELRVGMEFREDFPDCAEFYRKWTGLPIVLIVRARK